MKIHFGRAAVAGLATIALLGAGVSAAAAADSVTSDPRYAGTWYPADDNEVPIAPGATLQWDTPIVAQAAFGDANAALPAPADATGYKYFLVQQGHEYDMNYYSAQDTATFSGSMVEPNLTPANLIKAAGSNAPVAGTGAVKAAGGLYSLGLVYTNNSGVGIADHGVYFIHINITPGGAYTFSQTEVAKTSSTTTVTAPANATEGANVPISATVAPAAATGTVQFKDGAANIGSPVTLSGAAASTTISAIAAGSHSITAVYSGDSAYAASTSTAATITVAGTPVTTTTSNVTATPLTLPGEGSKPVAYSATISPAGATGTVTFKATSTTNPATVVAIGSTTAISPAGVATVQTSTVPAGSWTINAAFAGTGLYQNSSADGSAPLVLTASSGIENPSIPDEQNIKVVVPKGAIEITTPFTPTNPLDLTTLVLDQATSQYNLAAPVEFKDPITGASIKVQNTRPDHETWSAFVQSSDFTNHDDAGNSIAGTISASKLSMVGVTPAYISGNAIQADVVPSDIAALSSTAQPFAEYTGTSLGTVIINAKLDLKGVSSSTPSGNYATVLTFTAY